MKATSKLAATLALTTMLVSAGAWAGKSGGTDAWARAGAVVKAMQGDEKLVLTKGIMPLPLIPNAPPPPADAVPGAGYIAGIPRLKIPALKETDASLGVSYVFGGHTVIMRPSDVVKISNMIG